MPKHCDRKEDETMTQMCDTCAAAGIDTPATTRSRNPDWSGYQLCQPCAREYDFRPVTGQNLERYEGVTRAETSSAGGAFPLVQD